MRVCFNNFKNKKLSYILPSQIKLPNPSKINLLKPSMLPKNHKLIKVCSVLGLQHRYQNQHASKKLGRTQKSNSDGQRKKLQTQRNWSLIKGDDIARMKEIIKKPTKQQQELEKKLAEEEKQYKLALAKAKREEMLRLQQQKKKNLLPGEFQKQKQQYRNNIQNKAIGAAQEELDDVKLMNKMVAHAKAATIRGRQLQEKNRQWENYKIQEKKKDKLMEIQRLKKIKELQEIEERKKEEALKGKEVISQQIKARQIQHLIQRQEQERQTK